MRFGFSFEYHTISRKYCFLINEISPWNPGTYSCNQSSFLFLFLHQPIRKFTVQSVSRHMWCDWMIEFCAPATRREVSKYSFYHQLRPWNRTKQRVKMQLVGHSIWKWAWTWKHYRFREKCCNNYVGKNSTEFVSRSFLFFLSFLMTRFVCVVLTVLALTQ